jgi:tRNA 5-methylaminomethyl-2-thiouridine biosynthesis bifunctional protein
MSSSGQEARDWLGRPELDWDGSTPRSRLHDDIYYSPEDGLAEARFVFVEGIGGADFWQNRRHLVIGETGFGTGLNFLALWQAWNRTKRNGDRLTFISVEGYPLPRETVAHAHTNWPELSGLSEALVGKLPPPVPGFHAIDPAPDVRLILLQGEAQSMLSQLDASVDGWFLDGFAPSRNGDLWSEDVFREIARLSHPGARLATFTAAGAVRRGLAAAGFEVWKAPGFAGKRERALARMPRQLPECPSPALNPVIIGDGIAGRLTARAFARQGITARLIRAPGGEGAGSTNPAPLVTPRLTLHPGVYGRLQDMAYLHATRTYDALADGSDTPWLDPRSAIAIAREPEDAERQVRQLAFANWDESTGRRISPTEALELTGSGAPNGGVLFPAGGGLNRDLLFRQLEKFGQIVDCNGAPRIERTADGWRVTDDSGEVALTDCLIITAGPLSQSLLPAIAPFTNRVRGQIDFVSPAREKAAMTFGSYLTPGFRSADGNRVSALGATFDREADYHNGPARLSEWESADNFRQLAERLPDTDVLSPTGDGWAGWRLTTRDRMPFCGAISDGCWVLTGLGSRGFTHAPLLADHLAARITGEPDPLRRDIREALSPFRFG